MHRSKKNSRGWLFAPDERRIAMHVTCLLGITSSVSIPPRQLASSLPPRPPLRRLRPCTEPGRVPSGSLAVQAGGFVGLGLGACRPLRCCHSVRRGSRFGWEGGANTPREGGGRVGAPSRPRPRGSDADPPPPDAAPSPHTFPTARFGAGPRVSCTRASPLRPVVLRSPWAARRFRSAPPARRTRTNVFQVRSYCDIFPGCDEVSEVNTGLDVPIIYTVA